MTLDGSIFAFTALVALLTILPGADRALVAKVTLLDGRRAAFFTSLGICAGLPMHATASALGLSLILAPRTSPISGSARSVTRSGRPSIPRSPRAEHAATVPRSAGAGCRTC